MVGQHIGSYRVVRQLGAGGMGAVFEAVHDQLGRRAAIKVLMPHLCQDRETVKRFFNEARAVNIIHHPGIVDIAEYGQLPNGQAYIVMEFLEGESLGQRLRREGRLAHDTALRLAHQTAAALQAAHDKGIIHRDLKPDNVMLLPDPFLPGGARTKLLDFGIAKVTDPTAATHVHTQTGALMGTPLYMSPEQCRGAGGVGDRTDVYALGVMMYQMLSGHVPFMAAGTGEIMAMHMFSAARPLQELDRTIPPEVARLVNLMLAKAPEARPSMAQVAADLSRLAGGVSAARPQVPAAVSAVPVQPSTLGQAAGQARGSAAKVAVPVVLVGLMVAGGGFYVLRPGADKPASAPAKGRIQIITTPPGATVTVDGAEVPEKTPLDVQGPIGSKSKLRITLAGFEPREVIIPFTRDQRPPLNMVLFRETPPAEARPEPPAPPPVQTAQEPARPRSRGRGSREKPEPEPEPEPEKPGGDPEALLREAQTAYLNGNYQKAIDIAKPLWGPSSRARRIVGAAACNLRDVKLVGQAYRSLDPNARQFIVYVCQRAGVTFSNGQFQLSE